MKKSRADHFFEELPKTSIEDIRDEVVSDLLSLKKLSNREYILYQKYFELKEFSQKRSLVKIQQVKNQIATKEDITKLMEKIENNENFTVDIVEANTRSELDKWTILRLFVSSMTWSANPGRNLKFTIYLDGKIAGVVSLGSDVISMEARDKFIGWTSEEKMDKGKLTNTAIATTIVPMQPLGYLATGGKLLCLLLYHSLFRHLWKEKYGNELVGMTTTSLFGKNSQYLGMKKYWRTLGETKGQVNIQPSAHIYRKILKILKEEYTEEFQRMSESENAIRIATGLKDRTLSLFYKLSNFRDIWEMQGLKMKDLKHEFRRGVYFAQFYENTKEFLRNEITEKELVQRKSHTDFDIHSAESIARYWYRKFARNRYAKTKEEKLGIHFMDRIYHIDDPYQFINHYK